MTQNLPFDRQEDADDEYEEITSDEVDQVVEALEGLRATVASENIRAILEDAVSGVYYLVYEDDPDEQQEEAA